MSKGIRLFRVLGIEISLDYTWFIVFALFGWSLAYGYFPNYYPGLERPIYLFMGFVSALLLFGCVLIHELSHSWTANRLGLDITRITLFIFGGVAELTREPDTPVMELKIAIAGPIASGVLALIFWGLSQSIPVESYPVAYAITAYLSMINVVLLIFNMIPGLPLDGGRILRALWWAKTGDLNASTKVATQVGRGFAMLLIGLGFFQMMMGNLIGGFWAIIIGFFLQQAAISSYTELLFKDALDEVLVGDIMSSPAISIRDDCTLAAAVDQYFFTHHYVGFPVTAGGRVVGILTLRDVRAIDKERWADTLVRDAMTKLDPEELLQTGESAIDALKKLSAKKIGRGPVMKGGRLTGMLSRGDIMRVVELKTIKKG
jgi:Zn-dependent protease/CBS domain-containing protein